MEYDDFRRSMYCYWAQMKTFNKLVKMYIFICLFTALVVAAHNVTNPQFPAYVTSLSEDLVRLIQIANSFPSLERFDFSRFLLLKLASQWTGLVGLDCLGVLHDLPQHYAYGVV